MDSLSCLGFTPDKTPGSAWSEDAWISTSYVRAEDTSYLYYVSPEAKRIMQYSRPSGNTDWGPAKTGFIQWGTPQNGIVSVSWDDQLRLVYEDGGEMVVSALSPDGWTGPQKVEL